MTFAALLPLLLQYAPQAIGLIGHVVQNIAAGRAQTVITPDDWTELDRLAKLSSADIYARLGIEPPPAKP